MKSFFSLAFGVVGICLVAAEYRVIGDFESPDSFKQIWQTKRGVWAVSGAAAVRSEIHATQGKFALKIDFQGKKQDTWPYLEYRFPENDNDLSKFKQMQLTIVNPDKENRRLGGFFAARCLTDRDKQVRIWFNITAKPGVNRIVISLKSNQGNISKGGSGPGLGDWKSVDKVQIFLDRPRKDFVLYFDDIYLGQKPEIKIPVSQNIRLIKAEYFSGDWKMIPSFTMDRTNQGQSGNDPVKVRVAYDADNLYFHFDSPGVDGKNSTALRRVFPAVYNSGESIEIFIQSDQETPDVYYQFVFNSYGDRYDNRVTSVMQNPSWDRNWRVKVSRKPDGRWTAVAAFPWHIFSYSNGTKPHFRVNIFRNKSIPRGNLAYSPTFAGYHDLKKLVELECEVPDYQKYTTTIDSFSVNRPGLGNNEAIAEISAAKAGLIEMEILNRKNQTLYKSAHDVKKGNQIMRLPFSIKEAENQSLTLLIRKNGKVISESQCSFSLPPPISIEITEPYYRNTIFHGLVPKHIKGNIMLCMSNENLKKVTVHAALFNDAGTELETLRFHGVCRTIPFSFSTEKLQFGTFKICANLYHNDIGNIGKTEVALKYYPSKPDMVYVERDGFINVSGNKFFPLMLYPNINSSDLPEICNAGFNTVMCFAPFKADSQWISNFIDEAKKQRLRVLVLNSHHVCNNRTVKIPAYTRKLIPALIKKYANKKNLLSYNMLDEPNTYLFGPDEGYTQFYREMADLDPYHPIHIVENGECHIPVAHQHFADIFEFDFYPGFKKNGLCVRPLNTVPLKVRLLNKNLNPGKCIVVAFQGYDRVRTWDKFEQGRIANYIENRCLFWGSYAEGARGFSFWAYDDASVGCLATRPEWLGIIRTVQEFNIMLPVVFSPESADKLNISGISSEYIHATVREKNGYKYFIVAYSGEKPVTLSFSGKVLAGIQHLQVLGENRKIAVSDASFSDSFSRYAVHLYTNDPKPPKIRSVEQNIADCRSYENSFIERNKNNLIHRLYTSKKGSVRISATDSKGKEIKGSIYSAQIYYTVDGLRRHAFYYPAKVGKVQLLYELEEPVRMNKIVIRSMGNKPRKTIIRDLDIEILCGGIWKKVGSLQGNTETSPAVSFPAADVSGIRFSINKVICKEFVFIDEVEAYLIP